MPNFLSRFGVEPYLLALFVIVYSEIVYSIDIRVRVFNFSSELLVLISAIYLRLTFLATLCKPSALAFCTIRSKYE